MSMLFLSLGLALSIALFAYLAYVMVRPERF